ncbi:hypothetical protein [Companilactobacillus hulinensis]|uniref:hypothetical protein n=1 Tax=Companilactobacillus hulinensis TaxID=2486007 RepID=UPI000F77D376|nr:hypothetical protein [Companilactobacillus hulinensis]
MLQIKLVPYHEEVAKSEKQYVFTENLNMTIQNLEANDDKVIDIDFFDTKDTAYAAIKYNVQNDKEQEYLSKKNQSREGNLKRLRDMNNEENY